MHEEHADTGEGLQLMSYIIIGLCYKCYLSDRGMIVGVRQESICEVADPNSVKTTTQI